MADYAEFPESIGDFDGVNMLDFIFLDGPGVCLFNIDVRDDHCNSGVLLGGGVYQQ